MEKQCVAAWPLVYPDMWHPDVFVIYLEKVNKSGWFVVEFRGRWSCYYLCQCLDWNLFSINYLEDLHKLLPSQQSSFRDNNSSGGCKLWILNHKKSLDDFWPQHLAQGPCIPKMWGQSHFSWYEILFISKLLYSSNMQINSRSKFDNQT